MKKKILAVALSLGLVGLIVSAPVQANDGWGDRGRIKHVLLISVDGLHALDVAKYVAANKGSALAELSEHGVTFSNARTPSNSDSFPGLLALITGGSPNSSGLLYDVSYNRSIFDPTNTSCTGQPGNMQVYDETIDNYDTNNVSLNTINPAALPRYFDENGKCSPKYPHNAERTNTIFEVVKHELGARTAWADKHPAYDMVNGPSGKGVDDLYTPEITNAPGFDNTVSVVCTAQNDALKVQAILNEIHGLSSDGTKKVGVPAVFGMNFQAVSVGQKLEKDNKAGGCTSDTDPSINGQPGGYLDGAGTPTAVLSYGLKKTDDALWAMINALKAAHIYDSTLFIVTAKHGQSPINPVKVNKPGHFADLVAAVALTDPSPAADAIANANACSTGPCGFVQDDDIALIWLQDQIQTQLVTDYLNKHAAELFIDEVLGGNELALKFNSPLHDPAMPDILVQPIYGTIYTGSTAKNAEHGGFSFGDTNVGLIVSNPGLDRQTVKSPVATSQVAATILKALGIDPSELQAVRNEGTQALPLVFGGSD
ncbi:MAG: alkaline phosphatase family protein [Candidatus Acidiferrales bacterium]